MPHAKPEPPAKDGQMFGGESQAFGMPPDAQHRLIRHLDGFDCAVGGMSHGSERWSETVNGLMVNAVDPERLAADDCGQAESAGSSTLWTTSGRLVGTR